MPAAEGIHWACRGHQRGNSVRIIPTAAPLMIDQTLIGPRDSKPLLNAIATARQAWAAGAGNISEPSTLAVGTMTLNASTEATVPVKMPANCARNCLRGLAPSK